MIIFPFIWSDFIDYWFGVIPIVLKAKFTGYAGYWNVFNRDKTVHPFDLTEIESCTARCDPDFYTVLYTYTTARVY